MNNQFIIKTPSGNMIVANNIYDYALFGGGSSISSIAFLEILLMFSGVIFGILALLYLIPRCF